MTLVERLRSIDISWSDEGELAAAAADRIEELEAQIKTIKDQEPVGYASSESLKHIKDFDITLFGRAGFDWAVPLYTNEVLK